MGRSEANLFASKKNIYTDPWGFLGLLWCYDLNEACVTFDHWWFDFGTSKMFWRDLLMSVIILMNSALNKSLGTNELNSSKYWSQLIDFAEICLQAPICRNGSKFRIFPIFITQRCSHEKKIFKIGNGNPCGKIPAFIISFRQEKVALKMSQWDTTIGLSNFLIFENIKIDQNFSIFIFVFFI